MLSPPYGILMLVKSLLFKKVPQVGALNTPLAPAMSTRIKKPLSSRCRGAAGGVCFPLGNLGLLLHNEILKDNE